MALEEQFLNYYTPLLEGFCRDVAGIPPEGTRGIMVARAFTRPDGRYAYPL